MWLMVSRYLVTYYPLCMNSRGNKAIAKYDLKHFSDHSVRREPSLESAYPGITSICRGRNFAPRLQVDDIVVYLTTKGKYGGSEVGHYRVVAVLKVIHKFKDHQSAANWYLEKGLPIPSNCIVPNNPPFNFDHTVHTEQDAMEAEIAYQKRVSDNPEFLVCEPLKVELESPPFIFPFDLQNITGFTPTTLKATQNPGKDNISEDHLSNLLNMFD